LLNSNFGLAALAAGQSAGRVKQRQTAMGLDGAPPQRHRLRTELLGLATDSTGSESLNSPPADFCRVAFAGPRDLYDLLRDKTGGWIIAIRQPKRRQRIIVRFDDVPYLFGTERKTVQQMMMDSHGRSTLVGYVAPRLLHLQTNH